MTYKNNKPNHHRYLFTSEQVYAIEKSWFEKGNDSFGLMQQAAWQMSVWIHTQLLQHSSMEQNSTNSTKSMINIWVGCGNNAGDGWLVGYYLQSFGYDVNIIEIAPVQTQDAKKAKHMAMDVVASVLAFQQMDKVPQAVIQIDALFGIGLSRMPTGDYGKAIAQFNHSTQHMLAKAVAIDIPSGLVASTGQVFDGVAVQADITLCLIAPKIGLYIKDGQDVAGKVIDFPLVPWISTDKKVQELTQSHAIYLNSHYPLPPRRANSHKGDYGHVLIIGGNQIDGSQSMGMGGAAILSASASMSIGAGKVTVVCHHAFHGALLSRLPNAMSINLHDEQSVCHLIKQADVIAIGMGLGRDKRVKQRFITYLTHAIEYQKDLVLDADALYHLADIQDDIMVSQNLTFAQALQQHANICHVYFTPHTGEMARLLKQTSQDIEANRQSAIAQMVKKMGGSWLLKGAGSLVYEHQKMYVCDVGNAGMATAGMGDVLAGIAAGLLAQKQLTEEQKSLRQAILIHGQAGDWLIHHKTSNPYTLQAQDIISALPSLTIIGL